MKRLFVFITIILVLGQISQAEAKWYNPLDWLNFFKSQTANVSDTIQPTANPEPTNPEPQIIEKIVEKPVEKIIEKPVIKEVIKNVDNPNTLNELASLKSENEQLKAENKDLTDKLDATRIEFSKIVGYIDKYDKLVETLQTDLRSAYDNLLVCNSQIGYSYSAPQILESPLIVPQTILQTQLTTIQAKDFSLRSDLESKVRSLISSASPSSFEIVGTRKELEYLNLSDQTTVYGVRCVISDSPTEIKAQNEFQKQNSKIPRGR